MKQLSDTPAKHTKKEQEELLKSLKLRTHTSRMIDAVLDDREAALLEDAGIAYVDAAGRKWSPGEEPTSRVYKQSASSRRGLRPGGLRLAQLIADHPDEGWTVRKLARGGNASFVTAQRLLSLLESEKIMMRSGSGEKTERRVEDAKTMWHWLADHGRPHSVQWLSCFVSDKDPIPQSVDGHELVLTGALASEQMGYYVLTGDHDPIYRVHATAEELEHIPQALGGFRTDKGANLTLIADESGLASTDARLGENGQLLASPSRVMLDLFLETRGEAAANLFMNLWEGKQSP